MAFGLCCVSPQDPAADGSMPCIVCQALTSKRCSKCRKLSYCSKGCQASHWRFHRPQCRDDAKPYMDKARYEKHRQRDGEPHPMQD